MTRRALVVTSTVAAVAAVALTAFWKPPPLLLWNASASVPIGLYAVRPLARLQVGELVAAMPPGPLATFLSERRYLPGGLPLLKYVAALPGQRVCRHGLAIRIGGAVIATARLRDHAGRPLPVWRGCRTIASGEVFLLNADQPASLDGRYFGPLPRSTVLGRAVQIWTARGR